MGENNMDIDDFFTVDFSKDEDDIAYEKLAKQIKEAPEDWLSCLFDEVAKRCPDTFCEGGRYPRKDISLYVMEEIYDRQANRKYFR